jgi:cobalamin biosynthesis Mg chelatase CobN
LTARTNAVVQTHQTQSLRTVAEAQHCTESLKQLIEEYEEIEAGFEEVRRVREIV